jgi:multidrug efflux pump subunit AcrB
MAVIPFGMVGAVFGHALMGLPLTIFSLFGLIALTGVVVNDSIVLIDFINRHVRAGVPLRKALVESGRQRFRAVLLTSATTVAGLLPILTERSFQAQILVPMAASLVFGLMMSTVLVLLMIPTFYYIYCRTVERLTGKSLEDAAHSADDEAMSAEELEEYIPPDESPDDNPFVPYRAASGNG